MLKHTIILTLAMVLCQAGLFIVAGNTFGIGVYFIMHGSRYGSITTVGTIVLVLCAGGIVLSQGFAPFVAVPLTRALLPGTSIRKRSLLVVGSILGPVAGLAVAGLVGRLLGGAGSIGDIFIVMALWGFTAVAITASAVFWAVRATHAGNAA